MAFNVNDIKAQLEFGGARPTLFQVQIINPIEPAGDLKTPFLVNAAQIPEATIGLIEIPYFGRKVKIAGDRVFAPWNVQIMNDEDFLIRNAMETWQNSINSLQGNLNTTGGSGPNTYKSDAIVSQFGKTGDLVRQYKFVGIYPSLISNIQLSWEAVDEFERFDVEFNYDYWQVVDGITGNAGGI